MRTKPTWIALVVLISACSRRGTGNHAVDELSAWRAVLEAAPKLHHTKLVVPFPLVPSAGSTPALMEAVAHAPLDREGERELVKRMLANLLKGAPHVQQIPASAVPAPNAVLPVGAVTEQMRRGSSVNCRECDWLRLLKESKGFNEIVWLSSMVRQGDLALVYMETACDGHCGDTKLVLLERTDSGWVVRQVIGVSVV